MLKKLYLRLGQLNRIPYLADLYADMESHHVQVLSECEEACQAGEHDESLVICDSEKMAEWARQKGIGYLVYATQDNASGSFPENLCMIEGFDEVDYEFLNHMYERSQKLPWTILETRRCLLREITVKDVDRLYEIYQDKSITAYMEGLYENPEEEREFTRAYIRYMYGFYGFGLWLVVEKGTGRIIGRAGITTREGFENLEIGYLIEKERQRQGYAEEVCRGILTYAEERLGCEKINAFIQKENTASISLVQKLGFVFREEVRIEQKLMQRFEFVYKNFTKC